MLTRISIGILSFLGIAALILIVGVNEESHLAEREANFEARSIENGATLFAQACVGCHGIQGEGIPGVAPALNSAEFFTTRLKEVDYSGSLRDYIESTISAGRPVGSGKYSAVMPTWGQEYGGPLRPDQIHDLASFILNWEKTAIARGPSAAAEAPTPTPLPEGASPVELGKSLFTAQGCVGCHGEPYGAGGGIGPNLGGVATRAAERVPGQSAEEYIRESIINPGAFVVPDCPSGPCQPVMPPTYKDKLSEDELEALVQYLLTLK